MKLLKIAAIALLLMTGGMVVGCGGGGAKMETTTTTVTLGKQLMDLDQAYKNGSMSEEEFNQAKKDLLKKYN